MNDYKPLVSIIVPCYKQAQYLPDALQSVLTQTHTNWECIIVNDGSTDNTESVATEWVTKDNRFKYIKQENTGLSSARNTGLRVAMGEYIQLLDADDILEKNKLADQLDYLINCNTKIDIVVSGYRYFQDSDISRELQIFGPFNILPEVAINKEDRKDLVKLFARTNPMVISAPLYNKNVFERIGTFDESLSGNEDWDFHFRCAAKGIIFQHIGYPPQSKTLIRIHDSSMMTNKKNMSASLYKFRQKHSDNHIFALENGTSLLGYKKKAIFFLKMITPPVFIWLAKKIFKIYP